MEEHSSRPLQTREMQEFLKKIYHKEDVARLRGHLKNGKYRERQKTGEFRMITVLRNRYLGGVPKPGGYYRRVMDMKPADYRHRLPPDRDAEMVKKIIREQNLFTDPTIHEDMYPVDSKLHDMIYDGISRYGGGRMKYLTERKNFDPDIKYRYPLLASHRHGWHLSKHIDVADMKGSVHAHRKVIEGTFYSRNGLIPGLQLHVIGEKPLV